MPWIAYHTAGLPDSEQGGDPLLPIIRNVDVAGVSRSVLCRAFDRQENRDNIDRAVADYVASLGGAIEDWSVVQLSLADWQPVEAAVWGPVRAARDQAILDRKDALRTGFGQYLKAGSDVSGSDIVLVIPPAGAGRQEFLRSLKLLIIEALDPVFGDA